jgi:hypothetical protein
MENLAYVCSTFEIAEEIVDRISLNINRPWGRPFQRVNDSKWVVSYNSDPQQAWRFVGVIGYESIEPYSDEWYGSGE